MRGFPAALRLDKTTIARQDRSRLVACLAEPGIPGKPVLTSRTREALAALGLAVDGDPERTGGQQSLATVNHTARLIWLTATRQAARTKPQDVGRALGRTLAWLAPTYRLPGVQGPEAVFCARPDVLLIGRKPEEVEPPRAGAALSSAIRHAAAIRPAGRWWELTLKRGAGRHALEWMQRIRKERRADADLDYVPWRSPFAFVPRDALFGSQWNMRQVGAPDAWDLTTGARRVVIAVLDSGCDLDHADLAAAYVSDGFNAGDPALDGSPEVVAVSGTLRWHGTAVAGVIGAQIDNTVGVAGLAGGCGLLPVVIPNGSTSEFAEAVRGAVAAGAHVLNLSVSIGSYWFDRYVRAEIEAAVAAGRLVCASAGNGDASPLVLPARHPAVMACGGSDKSDHRWRIPPSWGSHFGDELYAGMPTGVAVVAPADDIPTTDITGPAGFTPADAPAGDYLYSSPGIPSAFNATSAAAPHVSAAAALLHSRFAALTAADVRRVLERTAEKVGGYAYVDVPGYPNGSRHPEVGYGRLSAFRALDFADVMIADWPGDAGTEPSTPPGGDYFSHSDVVIRPGDDGIFVPDDPSLSSVIERGREHTVAVRVQNVGPADARGVRVGVCATPWAGVSFVYPDDWTADDALHVRPAPVDAGPFAIPAGGERIARFRFTASQIDGLAGWTDRRWHPCLLAVTTSANDYAFADAPGGAALQMRRNNIAQRNLTVGPPLTERSAEFPFVIGHPTSVDPAVRLLIEAGRLATAGDVYLSLEDASRAFPAARKAQAFVSKPIKVGKIIGGREIRTSKRRAIRITARRAVVELVGPVPGRYALTLSLGWPADGAVKSGRHGVTVTALGLRGEITGGARFVIG